MWPDHTDRRVARYLQSLDVSALLAMSGALLTKGGSEGLTTISSLPRGIVETLQRQGLPVTNVIELQQEVQDFSPVASVERYLKSEYDRWTYCVRSTHWEAEHLCQRSNDVHVGNAALDRLSGPVLQDLYQVSPGDLCESLLSYWRQVICKGSHVTAIDRIARTHL
jgi:hypothetical protein